MPTQDQMEDFAKARFDERIQTSPYLRSRVQPEPPRRKAADSSRPKRIGPGTIFLRSTESARQVASVDADLVVLDEFDQMRAGTLERAEKRLASSRDGRLIVLSTPRLPESGVNSPYLISDQRLYYIRCLTCGEEQTLEWETNVDLDRGVIVCKRCRKPINTQVKGRWIPLHPENKRWHGYQLSRLYSPWADIPAMIEASKATTPLGLQEFYNSDLGLPFVAPGGGLTLNELDACRGDYRLGDYAGPPCVAGIDVGLKCHVVIRETLERRVPNPLNPDSSAPFAPWLWFAGEVSFADLDDLLNRYNARRSVIDGQPERHKAEEFALKSRATVWLADYNRYEPGYEMATGRPNRVHLHRTDLMDQTAERFRNQQVALPVDARQLGGKVKADGNGEYYREVLAPQRVPFKDSHGNLAYRWQEGSRDDDFFHAELYAYLAEVLRHPGLIGPL